MSSYSPCDSGLPERAAILISAMINKNENKKIVYVDMDNVLVDFPFGIAQLAPEEREKWIDNYDECPGIFALMRPMPGAVEAFHRLAERFDVYILSTAPWKNPSAWSDKLEWVKRHLGDDADSPAYKRLILSHHKNLCQGDFLIDDRTKNGADRFAGEHIHFGTSRFPNWSAVLGYILTEVKN